MIVKWQTNDGYCCGTRPHEMHLREEDLLGCETEEERMSLIEDYVQTAFEDTITWEIVSIEDD